MMAGLVQQGDLGYLGAFNVPQGDIGASSFEYGGTAITYNPAKNSLFMVGHDWQQAVAEISIPQPTQGAVSSLPEAELLQPFATVLNRLPNNSLQSDEMPKVGGLMVYNNQLIGTAYEYYDGAGNAVESHFKTSSLNLSSSSVFGLFKVGDLGGGMVGGYMAEVPAEWREAFGASYVTGQAAIPIIGRTSSGPALFGFDPAQLGSGTTAATPLVYYPIDHSLAPVETQNPLFNTTSDITGVVFPQGTDSVLFFGSHGTGQWWYGEADEGGFSDPYRQDKGPHAPDYVYQVWAYDAKDLVAVRNGQKQPWDVKPYDTWTFDLPYFDGGKHIGGIAYDAATSRLYVSQEFGNEAYPVVHVYQIGSPSGSSSSSPTSRNLAPTGLTLGRASIAENAPAGTPVGVFATIDPNTGDTFTYSLVNGTGSTNNGDFAIAGNTLVTARSFDFEVNSSLSIRVRTTDQNGLAHEGVVAVQVTNVNDAPVLNAAPAPTLDAIQEDAVNPAGTLVQKFAPGAITDQDVGAVKGIVVTAASDYHGTWQFTLDGGMSWQAIGASKSAARLLPADAATRVRFVPNADFNGTVRLWYHAWDRTTGNVGSTLAVAGNQGTTGALSMANESASLTVQPVNDAPRLGLGGTISYVSDAAAVGMAPFAGLTDVDNSNFAGGRLRVRIADGEAASNRLMIGPGFTVDANNNVLLGKTVIGKRAYNGFGTKELIVVFNANATPAVAQQLVRSIGFKTVGGEAGRRKVVFTVSDGAGGLSAEATKIVNVV